MRLKTRNGSQTHNNVKPSYISFSKRNPSKESSTNRNLPYQDTFDNGGMDENEPLASSRYKNVQNQRDNSISSGRSNEKTITHRVRHHRNISHASFPSDNSEEERGRLKPCTNNLERNNQALMKHSQSVLQFKDKHKVNSKKILR